MGKTLVIAEKPSVAADLARVLGKLHREKDYFEGDEWVVSSAIGHLVELALPEGVEVKRGKWKFENLPVIPPEFDLQPIEKTKSRFHLLKRLMKRKDIDRVVNACDAGREGELIFRYLAKLAGNQKPIERLWLQSMTPSAIKKGFEELRSDEAMIPLAKAAASRAEADWLVGINSTRALTAFNSQLGGFQLTPAGRVQTPTLAILVEREEKIRAFDPRGYYEVFGDFGVAAGAYRGRWFDEAFKKSDDEQAKAERIWDLETAEAIKARCEGRQGEITEEKKPSSQAAGFLYDLTSLQRDANGRFGFSARRTLQLAQQLYERHKVLTYPRTDSRFLPEDQIGQVKSALAKIDDPRLKTHARKALDAGWVKPTKKVFNNAKVSDHTAIIPTGTVPKGLDEAQQKIYDLVTKRFIAIFFPNAQFEITTRITRIERDAFRTDGKIIVDPGWMAVYGREAAGEDDDKNIAPIADGEKAETKAIELKENQTRPPARYNEATLLSAMEGAGKFVEDDELRAAMSAKGLGTPATRASIIEGLIAQEYIARAGRELIASSKGVTLIKLLRKLGVGALCLPELTGEWEYKLKQIETGELQRRVFMAEIREMTQDIVDKAKNGSEPGEDVFGTIEAKCPKCGGGPFQEDYRTFRCKACDYLMWKTLAGRVFSPDEARTLLEEKHLGPLEGFRSKMGRAFSAEIVLNEEFKPTFKFEQSANQVDAQDLSDKPVIGPCRACKGGTVHETETAFFCSNAASAEKSCKFRMGKTILQKQIAPEQVKKILENGKTDLLAGFISKKGRPFSAYLTLEGAKVGFEFEPREKKPKAAAKKPAAAK